MMSVCFQCKQFNIIVIQGYAQTTDAEEAEVNGFWRHIRPSRTNTRKKENVLFIIGDWNAKVRSQEIPGVTGKFALEYKLKHDKE